MSNWLFLTLFYDSIGKFFYPYENRYEGEWKDGKKHGLGKKEVINLWFIDSNILWWFNR